MAFRKKHVIKQRGEDDTLMDYVREKKLKEDLWQRPEEVEPQRTVDFDVYDEEET